MKKEAGPVLRPASCGCPALRLGLRFSVYLPELDVEACGWLLALGMLT